MKTDFWHQRWKNNRIGFHQALPNSLMVNHIDSLNLLAGQRVFLPLCGKTLDIAWLLSEGFRVVGAELSEIAIEQLFRELKLEPEITQCGSLLYYQAENIDMYVGDIFELTADVLGTVNAIYDRAALVALPSDLPNEKPNDMRTNYAKHLVEITGKARQLLLTFEYDQSLVPGPPFSVFSEEVDRLYAADYQITLLESVDLPGGLKGKFAAIECIWLLSS